MTTTEISLLLFAIISLLSTAWLKFKPYIILFYLKRKHGKSYVDPYVPISPAKEDMYEVFDAVRAAQQKPGGIGKPVSKETKSKS